MDKKSQPDNTESQSVNSDNTQSDNAEPAQSYGMEDYSDIEPMTTEQAQQRRKRSIAIASVLGFLIILFYITTITRLAENIKKMSAAKKDAAEITLPSAYKFSVLPNLSTKEQC